ncbi:MAG: sulfotransferase [Candidatus Sericytochromatia bacterium]|nr:sulfotransferase [Candidatus Sericytochromatia bacterium]
MTGNTHPNFLIGGTAAGGTSFLSAILVQHPQIYLPKEMRPEPHFFYKSWEYKKGLDHYLSRWFSDVPESAIAVGERSSSYLFGGDDVAKKVALQYPQMKFIFTLRNPIERTWANYRYTVLQGLEELTFEEALSKESQRIHQQSGIWAEIQPHNYTGRGFYASQLRQYLKYFPRDNILTIKSENLSTQTDIELNKIYTFLGLSILNFTYEPTPNFTSVNVIDPGMQKKLREYFGSRFDLIIEAIRKELSIDNLIMNSEDEKKINILTNNMTKNKQEISLYSKKYLSELFSKDIKDLASLVEFDISDWQ